MSEQQTPVAEAPAPDKRKSPATHEQKRKRRKLIRRIVTILIVAAVVVAAVYLLRKYVFTEEDSGLGEPMTMPVYRGSIQSMVQGTGNARAKNSAVVTPESGYTVLELFVSEGDMVEEGQLLYNLDDTAAQEAVRNAQENVRSAQENVTRAEENVQAARESVAKAEELVAGYQEELAKLYDDLSLLTVTAPHDGKLTEVDRTIGVGDDLTAGTVVATLVNDTKLRLSLYYSYAYEGQIHVGDAAQITLPAAMASYPGTVEQVNYVRRVVPEGSVTFEVVFVLDNPGTLTEGMSASAALKSADGADIYPYEGGTLEYYETSKITVRAAGPVERMSLMNYADVKAGDTLVKLGDRDAQAAIAAKQTAIREAQKNVESAQEGVTEAQKGVESAQKGVETAQQAVTEAQEKLESYHAVSPIAGKVLSIGGLAIGEPVPTGAGIQIADTATMVVDISIDERNIGYVKAGMYVDMQDQMGNYYMGMVETVALTAKAENGVASFPATVTVDNYDGMLMTNAYVNYSFIASRSSDCLIVPIQAVMNVTLNEDGGDFTGDGPMGGTDWDEPEEYDETEDGDAAGGPVAQSLAVVEVTIPAEDVFSTTQGAAAFSTPGTATVCFVEGEPDERAITADESWNMPEGFFAVVVETGLSDESNVEITSGLQEGDVVFYGYTTDSAYAGW